MVAQRWPSEEGWIVATDGADKHARDRQILVDFVGVYCHKKHGVERGELCQDCHELLNYALARLAKCPFDPKPKCKDCRVHCYKPEYRSRIQEVMRFSGPRILLYHPIEWLKHKL